MNILLFKKWVIFLFSSNEAIGLMNLENSSACFPKILIELMDVTGSLSPEFKITILLSGIIFLTLVLLFRDNLIFISMGVRFLIRYEKIAFWSLFILFSPLCSLYVVLCS